MTAYFCYICHQLRICGLMVVRREDGKGTNRERVCADCWDETIVKKGAGVTKEQGGKRVIRGTNSLT